MRQTTLRPGGIVTQPNEEGELSPGTLSVGDNVMMRRKSVLEPRPALEALYSQSLDPGDDAWVPVKMWTAELQEQLGAFHTWFVGRDVVTGDFTLVAETGSGAEAMTALTDRDGSDVLTCISGKTQMTQSNGRRIFTEELQPVVSDSDSSAVVRLAGFPPPIIERIGSTTGDNFANGNWLAYRAIFKHTTSSGIVVRGAASTSVAGQNGSGGDVQPTITVSWTLDTPVFEGVEIEVYRVIQQTSAAELGDSFRLSFTYALTSGDISTGSVSLGDTAKDEGLGDYLYANGNQEGASKNNQMPPRAIDAVTYKDSTFYVTPEGWHAVSSRIPYAWGALSSVNERATGIGSRTYTSTLTSGNATFTINSPFGIVPGQLITSGGFPVGTRLLSIFDTGSNYLITASANATSSGSQSVSIDDVVEIDSTYLLSMANVPRYIGTAGPVVVFSDQTILEGATLEGAGLSFFAPNPATGGFTIRATNGNRYSPELPEIDDTPQDSKADARSNRIHYSKIRQPEACTVDGTLLVGQGTLIKLVKNEDALLACATDGIYKIVGDGDDWSVTQFDPNTTILCSDAIDSMDNVIYAVTRTGFALITASGGVNPIGDEIIGRSIRQDIDEILDDDLGAPFTWASQVVCNGENREVWINFIDFLNDDPIRTWVWHADTSAMFTQSEAEFVGGCYSPYIGLMLGSLSPLPASTYRPVLVYSDDTYMNPTVVFNPVHADDLGTLKQWIDVTLFLEDLSANINLTPQFGGEGYTSSYVLSAASGSFEHVIAPVLNAVHNKHCEFGFTITGTGETGATWRLMGLSFRFRPASETIRA